MWKSLTLQVIGKSSIFILMTFLCLYKSGYAQQNTQGNYVIQYAFADDSTVLRKYSFSLRTRFTDSTEATAYAGDLIRDIRNLGYYTASLDSVFWGKENAQIKIYIGRYFPLIWTSDLPPYLKNLMITRELSGMEGWKSWRIVRERLLVYAENNGHPFAEVYLDNIRFIHDSVFALMRWNEGVLYRIDSIRLYGKLKIKNRVLQQQTGVIPGSVYNQKKIDEVDRRLLNFPFAVKTQNSDVSYLGTGGILNLYLQPKKCSQFDVMLGLQPAATSSGKAQLVGNVQLDLKNSFGFAEKIFLQWQQLQLKSPRLQLAFAQPFVASTKYGVEWEFGLFRKDSSFLQWQSSFLLSSHRTNHLTQIGFQYRQNTMLGGAIDTFLLRTENRIPDDVDSKSINAMLAFSGNTTNYPVNPRKGWEYHMQIVSGKRTIRANPILLSVKETQNFISGFYDSIGLSTYQVKFTGGFQHYIPISKYSVFTWGSQWGIFQAPYLFRNDLFQIGGRQLIRGFDEESIFADKYLLATLEYRFQLSRDGYFQLFTDLAHVENRMKAQYKKIRCWGSGLGIMYPTENGRISVALATGVRNDVSFQWRQSLRVHLGYISYF